MIELLKFRENMKLVRNFLMGNGNEGLQLKSVTGEEATHTDIEVQAFSLYMLHDYRGLSFCLEVK